MRCDYAKRSQTHFLNAPWSHISTQRMERWTLPSGNGHSAWVCLFPLSLLLCLFFGLSGEGWAVTIRWWCDSCSPRLAGVPYPLLRLRSLGTGGGKMPVLSVVSAPGGPACACIGSAAETGLWRSRTASCPGRWAPRCAVSCRFPGPRRPPACCWTAWRAGWTWGGRCARTSTASSAGTPSGRRKPCLVGFSWPIRAAAVSASSQELWRGCSIQPGWGRPACVLGGYWRGCRGSPWTAAKCTPTSLSPRSRAATLQVLVSVRRTCAETSSTLPPAGRASIR